MTTLEELLGIDPSSPDVVRAEQLAMNDRALLRELVAIRKERQLSQARVGEIMGISQPSVAAFEAHDSNPRLSTIRRYAHAVEALIVHRVEKDEGQLLDSTRRGEWVATSIRKTRVPVTDSPSVKKFTPVAPLGEARFRGGLPPAGTARPDFALAA